MTTPINISKSTGKRCLVFGGTGALGREVCKMLHEAGAKVAFTFYQNQLEADRLVEALPGVRALQLDLRSVAQIDKLIQQLASEWEGLDGFVQCAGVGPKPDELATEVHHTMKQVDEAAWDEMQDVNIKGSFFAVRSVAGEMVKNGGNIVLIGSIDGVKPVPAPVHYAASKGALVGMTAAMAKEFGGSGICVNIVAPGIMETGMSRVLPEELRKEYIKHCGLRRYGRVEEIAAWATWLSLHNTYVTGQTILVDGAL